MNAAEIRRRIIETVSANGGHLASSLGAVELSMALCRAFDPERDRIVWDVGHQAYAWKILTGRDEAFGTLRKMGGMAPFTTPLESKADAAVSGHAGAALSVALGMARSRDAFGRGESVVAVVGDEAFANGMNLEALLSLSSSPSKVIVVLNDNSTGQRPFPLALNGVKAIGPVDGHDLDALLSAFGEAKACGQSVLVHVVTKKGMGFAPAEENPAKWHAVAPAAPSKPPRTWSEAFGDAICGLAAKDLRVVALTAGMKDGTGLCAFSERFPGRFFDVGIAEEHMVGFAAGLAAGGMRPFVAVYSTFLQRCVDQVMHDVAIARLPVVFCVDRAGIAGQDGATHQGLYDIAMLRCLPNVSIFQPKDEEDLGALLAEALQKGAPSVIRYPRGECPAHVPLVEGPASAKVAIWCTGDWYRKACKVAKAVGGVAVCARSIKPFDAALLKRQREAGMAIVSLENAAVAGGLGEAIGADMRFGWPDEYIGHGPVAELEAKYGLDSGSVAAEIGSRLGFGFSKEV